MTRMRQPHNFHEVSVRNPETRCIKCSSETARVCQWCGACQTCHTGGSDVDKY